MLKDPNDGDRSNVQYLSSSASASRPFVIVIDDHADSLLITSYVLESLNVRYLSVTCGTEFFDLLKTIEPPNLILLDILLPDMSGFDLLAAIRGNQSFKHVSIVAVTAMGGLEVRKKIHAAGFADYLIKPFILEELQTLILKHLSIKS